MSRPRKGMLDRFFSAVRDFILTVLLIVVGTYFFASTDVDVKFTRKKDSIINDVVNIADGALALKSKIMR